jgi:CCCH-type zinc finger/RNA-binding, Nab2-type zinc finger
MAPCRFFTAGKCRFVTTCRNSHTYAPHDYTILPQAELRQNTSQNCAQGSTVNNLVTSKAACWFFPQGKCRYGAACKNSHDVQPQEHSLLYQASTTTTQPLDSDERIKKKSLFTETAQQINGLEDDTPRFMRTTGGENPRNQVPCRFFAIGCCRIGKNCRFVHEKFCAIVGTSGGEAVNQQLEVSA